MEEQTSWKNHGFTLLIFGGIVALSGIFFVLGMLVGRTQGQQMAKQALAEQAANAGPSETATDDFKLSFDAETSGDKADLKLEPAPPLPPPPPAASATKDSRPSISAPRQESKPKAAAIPVAAKPKPKPKAASSVFLQVFATRDEKKALEELKKVQSKGFAAKMVGVTADNAKLHRVLVGPYKESDINLRISDLHAKGYKEVIVRK